MLFLLFLLPENSFPYKVNAFSAFSAFALSHRLDGLQRTRLTSRISSSSSKKQKKQKKHLLYRESCSLEAEKAEKAFTL